MLPASTNVKEDFKAALALHQTGRLAEAEAIYSQILDSDPRHAEALHLLGLILFARKEAGGAVKLIEQAISIDRHFPVAHFNLARCYEDLKEWKQAQAHYEQAGRLDFDAAKVALARSSVLIELEDYRGAIEQAVTATKLAPQSAEAQCNLGIAYWLIGKIDAAAHAANKALLLNGKLSNALMLKGRLHAQEEQWDQAIVCYKQAAENGARSADFHAERANVLRQGKKYPDALAEFALARTIDKDATAQAFDEFACRMEICLWDEFAERSAMIRDVRIKKYDGSKPFTLSQVFDDPTANRNAAQITAQGVVDIDANSGVAAPPRIMRPLGARKIRLGYFSHDFKNHPVGQLIAGVLEAHDRNRFGTIAFSFGALTGDEWQNRILNGVDRYFQISKFGREETIRHALAQDLDIAIDLTGYTAGCRPYIFGRRVAPVQVNYLGYPGTMGADFMDYIIADKTVIPAELETNYDEKIAFMPDCFLPNDQSREIGVHQLKRSDVGLPENAFVFCCFNNYAKLNPPTFDRWAAIMAQVEGSVLWLPDRNEWVRNNLRAEAESRGITGDRLHFAGFADRAMYFDRFALADLFLDTYPYNAHTSAADALWGGVPVLTLAGEIFASRVAASCVEAAGLPELVTHSPDEFVTLAVALANDPARVAQMKTHLNSKRTKLALFDSKRYTRNLEAAYLEMVERSAAGQSPASFAVPVSP